MFLTRILLRVTTRKKYQAHKRSDHVCDKITFVSCLA